MEPSLDEQILEDLYYEIAREMPKEEEVALQMYKDSLLTPEEWGTHTKLTEDKREHLLTCLKRHKPEFLEKFCTVLDKVKAESLVIKISRHREVVSKAPNISGHRMTYEARYWRDKYQEVEKILKAHIKRNKKLQDQVHKLTLRKNSTFRSIIFQIQSQIDLNERELHHIQCNDLTASDLSEVQQRQKKISVASSSSIQPHSSSEDLSASSTVSLSSPAEGGIPQDDHEDHLQMSSFSGDMILVNQIEYKPFQCVVSDKSDRDSDGTHAVDPVPVTGRRPQNNLYDDDNDDAASVRTITRSVSQHSMEFHEQVLSHGDDELEEIQEETHSGRDNREVHSGGDELHSERDDEPEGLREFRQVHSRITGRHREAR